jgi:hypothetical protein
MTWKLYAVVSAGAFAATYLVSSPATEPARPASTAPPLSARQIAAGSDIERLAEGLHIRLRSDANYHTPGRDLFRFHSKPAPPAVVNPAPRAVIEATPVPAPVLPPMSLSGVATDMVDGSPRRAAVLSVPTGVLIAREGESVGGLYKVVSIGEESVELEAVADGSHRTLRLSGK